MDALKGLADYRVEMAQCVRCGACQAHCPVYLHTGREGSVARGKIVLAEALVEGRIEADDPRLQEELGLCLLCGSCLAHCPNQVPTDRIVAAARRLFTEGQGLSTVGKAAASLTGSRTLLRTLTRGAALLAPLLFKKIPEQSGLRLRFAPDLLKGRTLPAFTGQTLFDLIPPVLEGAPGQPTVGVFAGCALTYLFPRSGAWLARLPHLAGCTVYTPKNQGCCGMPALSTGNGPQTAHLAADNLAAFRAYRPDIMVTGCASCLGMLSGHYPDLGLNPSATRLVDIHVLLVEQGLDKRLAALPRKPEPVVVTYHDPCHLRLAGVSREPRALLRALPQVRFVEMEAAATCCGMGGTFTAAHPELSRAIGDRKAKHLKNSGAEIVATGCPGCMIQLQDIIERAGLPIRIMHTLELIGQALEPDRV
ncbi:MAG: (Fe-S)-binding protein [Desulfobulbus sp.]|jgi:glycolate oxidase iron-sulfur subunit